MLNMTRDVRESIILFERFIAQNYRRRKFAKVVGQKNGIRFCIFWREKIELRASFYSGEWQLPLPTPRSVGLARRKKHPGQFLRFRLNFNSYFFFIF